MSSEITPEQVSAIAAEIANQLNPSPWLDTVEAAEYLRFTENAFRHRLTQDNPPPSHRLGRIHRFARHELDQWVRGES